MFKIAISGGKGGTGKSTIAIIIAQEFLNKKKKVVLVDLDVECPNDYLLLGEKLKEVKKEIFQSFPKLNKRKCKKCGICAKACKSNAIFHTPGNYPIFIEDFCIGCGACRIVCPFGAIEEKRKKIGKVYLNKIKKNFWLITGAAKEGLRETEPVVKETKDFAIEFAKKNKADVVLFDTAAGLHCNVISAIMNTDLVYLVTEPTPLGAHDLNLMLQLLKKLKIPSKIILNRADVGDSKEIEKIAKKFRTKIERKIPHLKEILIKYSEGRLLNLNIGKLRRY